MSPTTPKALITTWLLYCKDRQCRVSPTTHLGYSKITNRLRGTKKQGGNLAGMPQWVTSGEDCLEWLLETYSQETTRQTLQQLKAACRWAVRHGHLRKDPFAQIDNLPVLAQSPLKYAAFSHTERLTLLAEISASMPAPQSHWAKLLLMTGARPSELRALRIRHLASTGTILQIHEAYPMGGKAPQSTKNRMMTDWPLNNQQRQVLRAAIANRTDPEDWIFLNSRLGPFDYTRFQRDWWGPMCDRLAKTGAIAFALSQYHCRHTWITEALKVLPLKDVEYLARVRAKTLLGTYAQRNREIQTPEI